MNVHVLSIYKMGWESDKMQGLPSIVSLYCNSLNKCSNTGAQRSDSIYHIT